MTYSSEYIKCKICGGDDTKFLGIRGNGEYAGAPARQKDQDHMVTNVVKCRNCGFIYVNPLIVYDTGAYQDPHDYNASSDVEPEKLFTHTLNLVEKFSKKGTILDVGSGKGEFLSLAKKRGWDTYGLEPSVNFAEYASKQYGLKIVSKPIEEAGYSDSFFDVITLNMVLEHLDEPRKTIRHIKKILKKDGVLFVEVPNTDGLMLKTAALYFKLKGKNWSPLLSPCHPPFHCYGYNVSCLKHLFRNEGFQIRNILVSDTSLRGFRKDAGGSGLEKFCRKVIAKFAGAIGRGDVLIAIAQKEQDEKI